MGDNKVNKLTLAAMIAACYVVITVAFAPIGFGEVQFRISEALTILPFFTPAAIPGLFIGCIIGNALGGAVIPDIVFGSLATLIGAVGTYMIGKMYRDGKLGYGLNKLGHGADGGKGKFAKVLPIILGTIPPIVANALIIPFVLKYAYGSPLPIPLMVLTVGLGEVISCGILGTVLGAVLQRSAVYLFK